MPLYLDGPVIRRGEALEDFETPFRTYLGAKYRDAIDNNVTPLLMENGRLNAEFRAPLLDPGDPTAGIEPTYGEPPTKIDAETARAKVKEANVRLDVPDDGIPQGALDILIARQKRRKAYDDAIARSPTGTRSVAGFGVSFLGAVMDPLNVASAFVPVVGEARYSLMLARASGAMGRAGVRAGVGAMEGLAGAAMLEPFAYGAHQGLQDDYKALDSVVNIGFGGVLGGGLHVAGGAVRDVLQPGRWGEVRRVNRALEDTARSDGRLPIDRAIDLPEIADVRAPFVARMADPVLREELAAMGREGGWAEIGGRLIRDPMTGEAAARTAWVLVADWWPGRPDGLSRERVEAAVDKALEGKRLSPAERRTVEYMLDVAQERRQSADFRPTAEELADEGLSLRDDFDASLVARAAELDEAAVERLAIAHENDDAAFMRGIKGLLDEHTQRQPHADAEAARRGEAGQSAQGAAATVRAADAQQRETALRTAVAQAADGRSVDVEPVFGGDLSVTLSRQSRAEAERLADPEGSQQADQRLQAAPKGEDLKAAEAELAKAMQDLQDRWTVSGRDPAALKAVDPDLETMTKQADELARAARAAALCDIGGA